MTDIVSYQLPFGVLGRIMHALFIRNKLETIFAYRFEVVEKLFNQH
jgi:ligand-binding SRPBCC domain-containing protein